LHKVDEKLDEIETIIALYEAKLENMPEEFFLNLPPIPEMQKNEIIERTDNPLQVAKAQAAPVIKSN
jgi:hypothetical protein